MHLSLNHCQNSFLKSKPQMSAIALFCEKNAEILKLSQCIISDIHVWEKILDFMYLCEE